jgi:hypothetical protein
VGLWVFAIDKRGKCQRQRQARPTRWPVKKLGVGHVVVLHRPNEGAFGVFVADDVLKKQSGNVDMTKGKSSKSNLNAQLITFVAVNKLLPDVFVLINMTNDF